MREIYDQPSLAAGLPLLSRLLTAILLLLIIGLLPWLSGVDPALALLRARSGEQEATLETLTMIRQSLGLDRGPWWLFTHWLSNLLQGDAGVSWISGQPVLPGMLRATGVSLTLMLLAATVAFCLTAVIALPLLLRGLAGDRITPGGMIPALLTTLPEFLLATSLLIMGAVWLKCFPPYGWQGLQHAVLPALALGIPAGGYLSRLVTDAIATTLGERWLLTWRVAGIARRHLLLAVIKRLLPALLPTIALVMVSMVGGAIAVEKVFAIPGLGRATLGAAVAQDLPTLQLGMVILLLLAMVAATLARLFQWLIAGRALRSAAMPVPDRIPTRASGYAAAVALFCLAALALILIVGLPRDATLSTFSRLQSPSLNLPFGADAMGRDLLARVAHGTLSTCITALLVALACLPMGLLAGLFPRLCSGPTEAANALPPVMAGLIVAAMSGPGTGGAALAVMLVSWAPLAAHAAALIAEVNARPYSRILPITGMSKRDQTLRYTLPAVMGPLFRHAMLRVPGIALALASLGFLGLGAAPPTPEWGRLLAEGMPYIERASWTVATPMLALLMLAILAIGAANLRINRRRYR